ncbi:MAG: pyridoxamine 5'-phosphate oxidase family protein [Actinobacteria bacterium]|nr:pyridoxamine 5'-phosphate oxidase family protein [Actinomycetota bacterium]
MISLDDVRSDSVRYGPLAYVATASRRGEPHVAPVAVAWFGDSVLTFVRTDSRKVANLRSNPRASVHFAVGPATNWDSCIVWGSVSIIEDDASRGSLWDKMGYDLSPFEPGGPTASTHVFLRIEPDRALILRNYGMAGREQWRR